MHTINHAAVGAGIALVIKQPALALPLALLSHFVLDALPHYGLVGDEGYGALFKHKKTLLMLIVDVVGMFVLIGLLWGQAWYVFAAMLLAPAPDLIWVYRYFWFERHGKLPPKPGPITRFHLWIQWAERPWGVYVEIPVAILLLVIISNLV